MGFRERSRSSGILIERKLYMEQYKCPKCQKELSEEEVNGHICFECGSLFYTKNNGQLKHMSRVIGDTRKMHYRGWIMFFIILLILWSIFTIYGIVVSYIYLKPAFKVLATIGAIILYALMFSFIQFEINMIRDVYLLKKKLEITQKQQK